MKALLTLVAIVLVYFIGYGIYGLFLLLSFASSQSDSSKTSDTLGFAPAVTKEVRALLVAERGIEALPIVPIQTLEHVFVGNAATDFGGSCVVDLQRAHQQTRRKLVHRDAIQHPAPKKFNSCEDYLKVTPPTVPDSFKDWGDITERVTHFCYPTQIAGAYRIWEHTTPPSGHLTIATVFPDWTAKEIISQLKQGGSGEGRTVKLQSYRTDPVEVSNKQLFEQTEVTSLKSISCDGFDVFQISIVAKQWPMVTDE